MARKRPLLTDDVLKPHPLIQFPGYFECPWCGRTFDRGGRREGFVKSGANNHVYACYEAKLYLLGYVHGSWTIVKKGRMVKTGPNSSESRGHIAGNLAQPIATADPNHVGFKRMIRCIRATLAKRRKEGVAWAAKTGSLMKP